MVQLLRRAIDLRAEFLSRFWNATCMDFILLSLFAGDNGRENYCRVLIFFLSFALLCFADCIRRMTCD
jgi:hypothetical protein